MEPSYLFLMNFNSIKVRLKLPLTAEEYVASNLFQFHKGTIKTTKGQFEKGRAKTFQFHKGTIKTTISIVCKPPQLLISIP